MNLSQTKQSARRVCLVSLRSMVPHAPAWSGFAATRWGQRVPPQPSAAWSRLSAAVLTSTRRWLILAMIAGCCTVPAEANEARSVKDIPFSDDYVLRTWEVMEGLRDNHISGIARGPEGYLWITNYSGLLRFDGSRFVLMDAKSLPGLPSPWVAPVFSARDGALWLGLERGGTARWSREDVDTILPIRPRPTSALWPASFAEEPSGAIWIGATEEARASRFSDGKLVNYSTAEGIPAGARTMVRVAGDGSAWVATAGGIAVFDGQRFHEIEPEARAAHRPVLAPSRQGGMWTIRDHALLRYDRAGRRLETVALPWLAEIGQINTLLEDHAGVLWIGTQDFGLLYFRNGEFRRVETSFSDISCLTEDREGHLWVGTWGGGLNRLSARRFHLREAGRLHQAPRSICEDAAGGLWVVDHTGKILRSLNGEAGGLAPLADWPEGSWATVVCPEPAGGVWLGTGDGLLRWADGKLSRTALRTPVRTLFKARTGALWVGTIANGMFRYDNGQVERIGGPDAVSAAAEDAAGRLWVGTTKGTLFRREGGRFEAVPLPGAGADQGVRFILSEENGTVWVGTLLGGLFRWREGRVDRLVDADGLSLAEVRSLFIERAGSDDSGASPRDVFWIGTATGLLRVERENLEGYLDGQRSAPHLVPYGSNEGLPHADFVEGSRGAACRTRDGRVWFATARGLLEIHPRVGRDQPAPPPRVVIEQAESGGTVFRSRSDAGGWVVPPLPRALLIRYTLPELGMPEQVRFRYRLDSGAAEGEWTEAGKQREVTLVQPGPGRYRFEVAAAVGDGQWLPVDAVEFTVRAAWWQTTAFRWGAVLAIVGAVAVGVRSIVRRRMRAQIRRLEQERAIERERGRIARDMHDELGANLTHMATLTRLAAIEPPEATAGHLKEIATVARETVDALDEIVWAVNPSNDTLANTAEYIGKFASCFLSAAGIEPDITLPESPLPWPLSAETRHHLFLAVKEALNNVARHSGARSARLSVAITPASLQVVVADDGRGFDPEAPDAFSNGLANMRKRLAGIGGRCLIESRPGTGSRITLELPLPEKVSLAP